MKKGITPSLVHQLGKPGLEKPLEVRVYVERVAACPHCGSGGFHRHGAMPRRRALHTFVAGRWVWLSWTPSRLRCPACGRTVTCSPKGMRRWARLTDEAVKTLVAYSRRLNYGSAAELLNLHRHRVRRTVMKCVGEGIMPEAGVPVVLTLDELSFRQQDYMCVVGELAPTKRVLTLLDNDLVRTIEGYLRSLKDSGVVVEAFVIDMKDSWRKLVKRVFSGVKVIVDPFHVVQDANRMLDGARLVVLSQGGPEEDHPAGQRRQGQQEISRWLINAEGAANAEGRVWANTVRSRRQELLNLAYYTGQGRKYTNGYIEGKITVIKMVTRLGFGFRSRESFRKKAFVGCCPQAQIPQLLT